MSRTALLAFMLILSGLFSQMTLAHDARPVVVSITEQIPGVYQFLIRVPETVEAGNQPAVLWPAGCVEQNTVLAANSGSGSVRCDEPLNGQSLSLSYPYFNPSLASFYRMTTLEGDIMTAMLTPTNPQWDVPLEATPGNVAIQYFSLGLEHILGGFDHLLFVLGLLVIARTVKRILWTVTGFTLAHSITLSLSSLGFVNIPIVPVEAVIALSIVFLAYEISREQNGRPEARQSLAYKFPLIVSFGFGLLHGLGFASALGEIGLVENEILISLLFFNVGVEAGQLVFILIVTAAFWLFYKSAQMFFSKNVNLNEVMTAQRMELLVAYVIGIPASYWLIDRVAQFLW